MSIPEIKINGHWTSFEQFIRHLEEFEIKCREEIEEKDRYIKQLEERNNKLLAALTESKLLRKNQMYY